jgi:hypothetical protein
LAERWTAMVIIIVSLLALVLGFQKLKDKVR